MIIVRPFAHNDDEYAAVVALENEIWQEYPSTVDEWKHDDKVRDKKYWFHRFVALVDDKIVGLGSTGDVRWAHKPGKFYVQVHVRPAFRQRGVGTALYEHGLAAIEKQPEPPRLLSSNTREDQEAGLRFLTQRGFVQVMRYPVSELRVAAFDPSPYDAVVARVRARGIEIMSLRTLAAQDPQWQRHVYDLCEKQIMPDVPLPDQYTPQTFERFVNGFFENPNFNPDSIFVARDGDRLVGTTGFWIPEAYNGTVYTMLTGVVRDYRRRNIARALKVHSLKFARAFGATIVETDNEENNPMYQINVQLGFTPRPAWIDFHKRLAAD